MRKCNSIRAVAACDGAGSRKEGKTAASLISVFLANELANKFDSLYYSDSESAKIKTIRAIEHCLSTYAREENIVPSELACTIVAAAMDDDGRCICFHLGDGMILRRKAGKNSWDIISNPRNGILHSTTFLTMNCSLLSNLQYYRWKDSEMQQLLLMTDGASDHLASRSADGGWEFKEKYSYDLIRSYLKSVSPKDDYSFGIIARKVE